MLDPGHGKKVESVRAGIAAVVAVLAAALLASPALAADLKKPQELFRDGLKALDREDWVKAADLMSEAASKQKEDGAPIRIYGVRFEPYLPLYFQGLALYKQGKCEDALKEWELSLKVGAVQRTEKQQSLLRYREDCLRKAAVSGLLPLGKTLPGLRDQLRDIQRLQADGS